MLYVQCYVLCLETRPFSARSEWITWTSYKRRWTSFTWHCRGIFGYHEQRTETNFSVRVRKICEMLEILCWLHMDNKNKKYTVTLTFKKHISSPLLLMWNVRKNCNLPHPFLNSETTESLLEDKNQISKDKNFSKYAFSYFFAPDDMSPLN